MDNAPAKAGGGFRFDPDVIARLGDRLLDQVRRLLKPARYEQADRWFAVVGKYALLAAAILQVLLAVVGAIKSNTFSALLSGLGTAALTLALLYAAGKFLAANRRLVDNAPSDLSSEAFLQCVALLTAIGGVVGLVYFTYAAIRDSSWANFALAVGLFAVCELVACGCLNPELLKIRIAPDAGPGQECIGVWSFLVKTVMRLVPAVFVTLSVSGVIGLLILLVKLLANKLPGAFELLAPGQVITAGLMPLAAYLAFLAAFLLVDLVRAILRCGAPDRKA